MPLKEKIKSLFEPKDDKVGENPLFLIVLITLVVLFVLGIIRPFGIERMVLSNYMGVLLYSSIGTIAGILFIIYVISPLLKSIYLSEEVTTWKIIIRNLINAICSAIFVAISSVIYTTLRFDVPVSELGSHFIFHLFAVLVIYPLPAIIMEIWSRNRKLTRYLKEAQEMNTHLLTKARPEDENITTMVTLCGSTKDSVELSSDDLLYLEAFGNYIKIFYKQEGTIKNKTIRATIKQMEEELMPHPAIIRCHRAFLVNTDNIANVKGNSQGYRLTFLNHDTEIPVSRSYTKALKSRIDAI